MTAQWSQYLQSSSTKLLSRSDVLLTDEGRVPVLSSTGDDIGAVSVRNEQIRSCKGFEDPTGLTNKDRAVKMALSHVVHVDGIEDCARRGGSYLPYGASECVASVERGDRNTLAFSYILVSLAVWKTDWRTHLANDKAESTEVH